MKKVLLTVFALTAFAFNSILCRMALRTDEINPASFTAVRLISGALVLCLLAFSFKKTRDLRRTGQWPSAFFLFIYAICFSLAYLQLSTGTGALILFGSVQLTMIAAALAKGERPGSLEWLGLATAVGGLVYLTLPGLQSPPLNSSLLMAAAGASWGLYTIRGKSSKDPLADTTGNFVLALPFALIALIVFWPNVHLSFHGIILAVLSGSIASGIGYAIWYAALRYHTAARAAVLQLSVPVIAAFGGVVLLGETASMRLGIAAALILGGISLAIAGRKS
jgi:drug/metabolite transporter (DMT)-like permease